MMQPTTYYLSMPPQISPQLYIYIYITEGISVHLVIEPVHLKLP